MLATQTTHANSFPFCCAAVPLSPEQRQALLPCRLGQAWLRAQWLEQALTRLDLSCLARLYRARGSLPFPPQLLLLLALFCIADNLASPSDWAEMANRDGPCRWLLGGIEPSTSVCYAFRDRLSESCLLDLNRQVLALAQADGLGPSNRAAIDGTLQEASASRHHLVNQQRLEQGLRELQEPAASASGAVEPPAASQQTAATLQTQPMVPASPTTNDSACQRGRARRAARPARTKTGRSRQRQRWEYAKEQLQKKQARNHKKRSSKRRDPKKIVVSPTDPEAAIGLDKLGVFRPLYNTQLVADLDSDLILGYEVLPQQNDSGVLGMILDRTESWLGHRLELALVDGAYVGGQDLSEAENRGVQILGPIAAEPKSKQLPKSAFSYDAERDEYVCPEGKRMACVGQSKQKRSSVELVVLGQYRCTQGECQQCPQRQQCCPRSKQGRSISRSEHEGAVERLKERMSREENKQKYKRRAATVERLFGDGKEKRGMKRVHGRGLKNARIQLALTVLQHNLRVLSSASQAATKHKGDPPLQRQIT
jgi:hypothetical protein